MATTFTPLREYPPGEREKASRPELQEVLDNLHTVIGELQTSINNVENESTIWADITAGASPTVNNSNGVSSCTQSATGIYVVNWTTAFSAANDYAVSCTPLHATTDLFVTITAKATGSVTVKFSNTAGADTDPTSFDIIAMGDQ